MCSSICLFYYSFLFHIRFHVGQDGHGAHEHVQRAAAHAQLHHGQQPAYASKSSATPGHDIPWGLGSPWAVWECGWGPFLCTMKDTDPNRAAGKAAPKGFLGIWKDALFGGIRRERALKDVVLNKHFSQVFKGKGPQICKATNLG